MKKFRKLIPALCMLLVSALFVGTSTYAWFSMNTSVSATDMQVTAKSNSQYLLIGNENTVGAVQTSAKVTEKAKFIGEENQQAANKQVFPVIYADKDNMTLGKNENKDYTLTKGNWYTAQSTDPAKATENIINQKQVESNDLKNYVMEYKTYLALSKDSTEYTGTLKVSAKFGEGADAAVTAYVKIGDTVALLDNKEAGTKETTFSNVNIKNGVSDNATEVTIYVYIDGNSTNVYSDYINGKGENEAKSITGGLTLTFDISAGTASST